MEKSFNDIEDKLIRYFSGDGTESDSIVIDNWRKESPDNEKIFKEMKYGWDALPVLKEMEQFNSFKALNKINPQLKSSNNTNWLIYLQRIAAVLIIPILAYAGYITINNQSLKQLAIEKPIMQRVTSRQGMVSELTLADGTKVWLNSNSTLEFPVKFNSAKREVKLSGEAFFEVASDEEKPFVLNAKELNVEVLGTSFNVASYDNEPVSEVVLVTGKVKLFSQENNKQTQFGFINPGQKAVYTRKTHLLYSEEVNVDKYIAWRQGNLVFRDDSMGEVIKRLSRWFNVEISVNDPVINDYIYTASFSNENLKQVLFLLKISAPIDYKVIERKALGNGEFTKEKVILMKRKK